MSEETFESMAPSLQALLDQKELKWIFVGGKGGVGKTTSSSCLAIQLSKVRESVLILSTDPAHNLSDAFGQQFSKKPTLVEGFNNLYAMEVDPTIEQETSVLPGADNSMMKDMMGSIPGIDEAMSFAEVMRLVQSMEFSVVVFDTAPTGHTLRFLSFPSLMEKGLSKLLSLKSRFSGLFSQVSSMFGMPQEHSEEEILDRVSHTQKVIEEVAAQFKNPDLTTFVCVCIPEFLSLYETERLIVELAKFEIDTQNIIINQVIHPNNKQHCTLCDTRAKMQRKYISQIDDLYEDFHVVKMPLLAGEIRGVENLRTFGELLVKPYDPNTHHISLVQPTLNATATSTSTSSSTSSSSSSRI